MKSIAEPRKYSRLFLLICIALAACNVPANPAATPTMNVTQAYATVEARLTQAIGQTPVTESSPAPTDRGVATATEPVPTSTPAPVEASQTPTAPASSPPAANPCDQAAPGVPIDVTIPDETRMQPGEEFTKTWRLVNAGTCTWGTDYALVWFSGEQMNAPARVPLNEPVAPGQTVDLSVDLEAPQNPGTYTSYWKLSNANGGLFGIGPSGGAAFWVQIVVVTSTTGTASVTAPASVTPTVTPTTGVQASGSATLEPDDGLDLDGNGLNAGGEDIVYQLSGEAHILLPQGSAALAVFGAAQPSLNDCQSITLSGDALGINDLAEGTYLCYLTDMSLPGWARLAGPPGDSGELGLEFFTWSIP